MTWDCSEEFDATSDQPISFLSDTSFISFPNWIARTGAMISFKVRHFDIYSILKIRKLELRNLEKDELSKTRLRTIKECEPLEMVPKVYFLLKCLQDVGNARSVICEIQTVSKLLSKAKQ